MIWISNVLQVIARTKPFVLYAWLNLLTYIGNTIKIGQSFILYGLVTAVSEVLASLNENGSYVTRDYYTQ